jgi:hypothetical protein
MKSRFVYINMYTGDTLALSEGDPPSEQWVLWKVVRSKKQYNRDSKKRKQYLRKLRLIIANEKLKERRAIDAGNGGGMCSSVIYL